MSQTMTATYYVTRNAVSDGQRFVHSGNCQVIPETDLQELGEFEGCEPAMEHARECFDDVNGCAMCCSDCYVGSKAFEAKVSDD